MLMRFDDKMMNFSGKFMNFKKEEGDFVVIGGKKYKTVTIGNQTWLGENLDFDTDSGSIKHEIDTYGRLYQWNKAMEIAYYIEGWHLPSKDEWNTLYSSVGSDATKLKSESGWKYNNGTDDFGFCVLPAGYYLGEYPYYIGENATFWTSDIEGNYRGKVFFTNGMYTSNDTNEYYYSVRLIKDN